MERFLQKEHALLNYTSRRSLGSQKLIRNSSEVDFNDVFGGPPRRSSMQDWRDRADSSSSRGEEDVASSSDVWSGLCEKPVFGEESMNRRKYPSDDFYEDIFRGDDSFSSTPKKPGRDSFSSTPASRVQSPVRPMQGHSDPFGSSSLPPVLSPQNSGSSSNGLGFPSSPNVLLSRISTQVMQGQGELRNDRQSFNRQSSLSKVFFPESDGSSLVTKSNKQDIEGHSKRNSSTEVIDSTCQFHFSIYKWARTGIPVVMPLRDANVSGLKGRARPEKRSNEFYEPVFEGGEIPSLGDNMLPIHKPFQHDSENQNDSSVLNKKKDRVDTQDVEQIICAKPESKPLVAIENIFEEVPGDLPSQTVEKESKRDCSSSGAAAKKGLSDKEKKMPTSMQKEQESERIPLYRLLKDDTCRQGNKGIEQARGKEGKEKRTPASKKIGNKSDPPPLDCLVNDDSDRQGHDKIVEQARGKEEKVKSLNILAEDVAKGKKGKKQTGKGNSLKYSEVTNSRLQDSPVNAEEKHISNKVKGKVKDFAKIFNREPSSKRITTDEVPDRVPAVNDSSINITEDQANVHEVEADDKGKVTSMKKRTSYSINSVDKTSKQSVKPHLGVNTAARQTYDMSSERVNSPASYSEKNPESAGVPVGNVDESQCPLLDCMVKELSQDPNEQAQTGQLTEDLQVWDAKIRKWSNGKEGNIRSLLSTLQYVLWLESGWKPVPLVDIIEGNPVKRAYQKALLCLHPDKLQQKGAAPHQKYIAEKVFDILQEAWTRFNSLDSI